MTPPVSPTREAIISAFNRLVLSTRRARPPIAQLLREAGVARSTFYKHFDDRDTLLLEAMRGPLSAIANAAFAAHESNQGLIALLDHFWDQRRNAADVFEGTLATRLVRALAALMMERAPDLERGDAIRIADTQIAFVRLWISGETPCSSSALAGKMVASAQGQRTALRG